ncbi:MAG: DUF4249 domain-containing protein [Bacteroidetes bacterium]|nr:DUF4249 domain-containing protein [Bacteroidota bacterium]
MRFILSISALLFFTACEKVISVDLDEGKKQLIVDGFITNEATTQKIKLSITQPYFDNATPPAATGAIVKVISSEGDTFKFAEQSNTGEYIWTPSVNDSICKVGIKYTLQINYEGSLYESFNATQQVPSIDSLKFSKSEGFGPPGNGYTAEFFANDFGGQNDYYWIKYYKNDSLFSDPASILVSINGAIFAPGADGFLFIAPVRFGINDGAKQYQLGDSVKVEVLSITEDTWQFFGEAKTQMNNGGLFATPPSNVRTNISKTSGNGMSAMGWFSTSALSRRVEVVK